MSWFKSKMKKVKLCEHKWEPFNTFVISKDGKDYPRISYICLKCKVLVHKPLHSYDELKRREKEVLGAEEEYNEQNE